eukprot:scaffold18890_cov60-Phaeocystis_antarctica.AAC.5
MATAALGDFENKLAASENHKETLLAEVNNLKEEMEVLQREGAKKPRASLTGGGGGSGRFGGGSATQAQVQMLEAKVEALEEENRTLRQRELMRKMFALGDKAMADEASGGGGEAAATPAPAAPSNGGAAPPPKIEFTLLRGFTARELVTFDPFRGFDMAQADGFANIEEEAEAAKPRKKGAEQQVEALTRQSTLSRISSFMGSFRSKQQVTPS